VQGDRVIFAHLGQPLQDLRDYIGERPETIFESRDFALQYCEDRLIADALPGGDDPVVPFEDFDIFRGLSPEQIGLLREAAEPLRFAPGDRIAHEGEKGDRFFVLARGDASIRSTVSSPTGLHSLRLSTIGPGMCFGERALIDGGQRLADVIADSAVEVWAFPVDRVRTIGVSEPQILVTLLGNMAADLSERLQLANAEIRAFAS
jgi:glutaminase